MSKQTATIHDWTLTRTPHGHFVLAGRVEDHPRQAEFATKYQMTSRILAFDGDKGTAETQNTLYTLGKAAEPLPTNADIVPDAPGVQS